MGSNINEANILTTDNSLNDYGVNIYDPDTGVQLEISSFLQGLTFVKPTQGDIKNRDNSYSEFYDDLQESNQINNELNNLVSKYETGDAKLKNAQKTNTYYLLLVWVLIFVFVTTALFLSVIEDKKELNIYSKILLFLFSLVVFFYIAKNSWFYIERNIQ